MRKSMLSWYRNYRLYWLAGAVLWLIVAAGTWPYAQTRGLPYLKTMVTWDEWVVAVLLLPWLTHFLLVGLGKATRGSRVNAAMQNIVVGGSLQALNDQVAAEFAPESNASPVGWVSRLTAVAVAVFALDLLVRAVFGLGWQPFV